MSGRVEAKLQELGLILPRPAAPVATYVPTVRSGNQLFVSGQLCFAADGTLKHKGKLGAEFSTEAGQEAARLCALNVLAHVQAAVGDLDRIVRCVRLGGFINCTPTFPDLPKVMNGASDLMVAILGDAGRHARTTIGVPQLPLDAAVEVEAIFEID